jgi:hypothetical protein
MNGRARRWPSHVVLATTLLLVLVASVLPSNQLPVGSDDLVDTRVLDALLSIQAVTFAGVAWLIARAQPRHAIARLFAGVGLVVAFYLVVERYQYLALVVHPELPFGVAAAWLQAWLYVPALGIVISVLPQLFPNGRPVSGRWAWGLVLSAVAFIGVVLTDALNPGRIDQSTIENPFGIDPVWHARLAEVATTMLLVSSVVGVASLVARWRRAGARERQQLKLFAYAAALLPVFVLLTGLTQSLGIDEAAARWISFAAATGAFLGLPLATAASIVRHQLYDIDLVINRTLVYVGLTAVLVATYLVSVLAFRVVLDPIAGESDLAVAASTLAVAAMFRPGRSRIQAVVDRRFYRQRYNAALTLEEFSGRLRHEVDLDSLGVELRSVVHDTMQPAHVTLWLRREP